MSRIGKKPISIPKGVEITIDGSEVTVKGPKGQLSQRFNPDMSITQEDGEIVISRPSDQKHHKALHGLTRALLSNMVTGVSEGFTRILDIEGVGYRAEMADDVLVLHLGYSHDIRVTPPTPETSFDVRKDSRGREITVTGIDKQVVGEIAAFIRGRRPPEPYKGKGVRYRGEIVRMKAGKTGKK